MQVILFGFERTDQFRGQVLEELAREEPGGRRAAAPNPRPAAQEGLLQKLWGTVKGWANLD